MRRDLEPVMVAARFEEVTVRRPDLRAPFPPRFGARLVGRTVLRLERRAKYILAPLSSDETLLIHLGMSGSFRVSPVMPGSEAIELAHDHVVFRMSSDVRVTFNDPRRFGLMDLLTPAQLAEHPALRALGPEPLSPAFNAEVLASACRGKMVAIKLALLDQRIVAGLGNIYACEALHRAHISPLKRAAALATASGRPRDTAHRLTTAIRQVLTEAVERVSSRAYRANPFRVYDREGERCPTPGCGGTIRRVTQNGRSTFFCRRCQR